VSLDEKIRLIVELTGWSEGKALTECVRCIPEEYIEPDGQRNTEHTEEGADTVLVRLQENTIWLCLISSNGVLRQVPATWSEALLGRLDRVCFGVEEVNGVKVPAAFSGSYSIVPRCLVPDWQSLPIYEDKQQL